MCSPIRMEQQVPDVDCDDWILVRVRPKHNIFLSHSGPQKDFVEQLCKDLEDANMSPFFDRRLPKGEEFAPRILAAARECEVAVVVISDDYFFRGKWPMLELVAMMQPPRCVKIVPLFYKLTCKEFKRPTRQARWFQRWTEWAESDPLSRIDLEAWKKALKTLENFNGMEFHQVVGEFRYRQDVVGEICGLMPLQPQDEVIDVEACTSESNPNPAQHQKGFKMRFNMKIVRYNWDAMDGCLMNECILITFCDDCLS